MVIWALTHFIDHDSRDPSGLTLAHQPARSSASKCNLSGSRTRKTYNDLEGAFLVIRTNCLWWPYTHKPKQVALR